MSSSGKSPEEKGFVVVPRETCVSCHAYSGPKFFLPGMQDASVTSNSQAHQERGAVESDSPNHKPVIERMDDEVSSLQQTLMALRSHRNLFIPLHKLSVDLIERIFLEAQHDYYYDTAHTGRHWHAGQVASQVSSLLRSISHSSTLMWSYVTICRPQRALPHCDPGVQAFIKKCLLLSKEAPLTIRFLYGSLSSDSYTQLAENAYRWKSFASRDYKQEVFESIMSRIPQHMSFLNLKEIDLYSLPLFTSLNPTPVLESFRLDWPGFYNGRYPQMVFTEAPQLTRVALTDLNIPLDNIVLPWSQIVHLSLTNKGPATTAYDLHDILPRMTHIKHIYISGPAQSTESVVLLLLETLHTYLSLAHNFLTAPSLKELHIDAVDAGVFNTPASITEFLRRSGCTLEVLTLGGFYMDEPWDANEFRSLKTLRFMHPLGESLAQYLRQQMASYGYNIPNSVFDFENLKQRNSDDLVGISIEVLRIPLRRFLAEPSESRASRCLERVELTVGRLKEQSINLLKQFLESDEVRLSGIQIAIGYRKWDNPSSGLQFFT